MPKQLGFLFKIILSIQMKKNTIYIAASFVIFGGLLGWGIYFPYQQGKRSILC